MTKFFRRCLLCVRRKMSIALFVTVVVVCIRIRQYHVSQVYKEQESVLDHTRSVFMKAMYRWMCPKQSTNHDNAKCPALPPIIMLNARTHRPPASILSWDHISDQLVLYNTSQLSLTYKIVPGCRTSSWRARLFAIYQHIFQEIINQNQYKNVTHFIFVEDDAILTSFDLLQQEVCLAQMNQLPFYSLFQTNTQTSCLYDSGTVAFYLTRSFIIEKLLHVDLSSKCRLGIDMYIASIGPWFATTKSVIKHNGTRYTP